MQRCCTSFKFAKIQQGKHPGIQTFEEGNLLQSGAMPLHRLSLSLPKSNRRFPAWFSKDCFLLWHRFGLIPQGSLPIASTMSWILFRKQVFLHKSFSLCFLVCCSCSCVSDQFSFDKAQPKIIMHHESKLCNARLTTRKHAAPKLTTTLFLVSSCSTMHHNFRQHQNVEFYQKTSSTTIWRRGRERLNGPKGNTAILTPTRASSCGTSYTTKDETLDEQKRAMFQKKKHSEWDQKKDWQDDNKRKLYDFFSPNFPGTS